MNDPQNDFTPILTPRQREVLEFIRNHFRKFNCAPTVRELAKGMGIRSPNGAVGHLEALQRKGFLQRLPNLSRSIILTEAATPQRNGLPVAALLENGQLVENPDSNEMMDFHEKTRINGREFSWIRVQTDWKLNDIHLKKGDFLLVCRSRNASAGETVLVQNFKNEALLARCQFDEMTRKTVLKTSTCRIENAASTVYGILVLVMRFEF